MPYPGVHFRIDCTDAYALVAACTVVVVSSDAVVLASTIVGVHGNVECHTDERLKVGDWYGDEEHEPEDQIHSNVRAGDHWSGSAQSHSDIGNVPDEGDTKRNEKPPAEEPGVARSAHGDDHTDQGDETESELGRPVVLIDAGARAGVEDHDCRGLGFVFGEADR